ncbi:MAG: complex I NDUFA9 subunit family protein [Verrucomicrobiales bacterium]
MRILVTGGTGVIGCGLLPELLKAGHEVRILSRGADKAVQDYPQGVSGFPCDITDPESLAGAAEGCEAVIHITGIVEETPPAATFQAVNVEGTRNIMVEAIRAGARKFIYLSSLGTDHGKSPYHQSKREGESIVRAFPGEWTILRPGNVYGPHDDVISTLLKMVRSLPAVPIVDGGDQPFQPIWHQDLAKAISQTVTMPGLHGRILELAGCDITTTTEIIDKLCQVTSRKPVKIGFPSWLAQLGVKVAEKVGANSAMAEKANLALPLNSSKLQMLMEDNVIRDASQNALVHVFGIEPLPLDHGLVQLADALPEMSPDQGVGKLERKRFTADIFNSAYNARELCHMVRRRINEVMPIDFNSEPGAATKVEQGATFTGNIPGRGNIQVRVLDDKPNHFSLITVEGHPLAGVVEFSAEDLPSGLRFEICTTVRASNVFDWLAMKTIGQSMQDRNWVQAVNNVVDFSGGTAPGGVVTSVEHLEAVEAREEEGKIEEKLHKVKRKENATAAFGSA